MAERPLRVVHMLDTISMLGGGITEAVRGLCLALIGQGVDVQVVAGRDARSDSDLPRWEGVPVTLVTTRSIADKLAGTSLAAAVRQAAPDLIHLHGVWGIASRAATQLAAAGGPVLLSPHGMFDAWALRRSRAKKRLSALVWEGRLLRRVRMLHALCTAEADSIAAVRADAAIATIPNGVALPASMEHKTAESPRTMLFLGRLHPKKGVAELVDAWTKLPAEIRQSWRLVIAGWDELGMLPKLQAQAETLGIGREVEFPGAVLGAAKDALFRSADAFILPSYSEGLPMAVLEAWSYGLPVFMTDACNLPEGFASAAAFRIDSTSARIAAVLAGRLADRQALEAAGRAGRALAERDYGWEAVAAAMVSAYAEAVPEKS